MAQYAAMPFWTDAYLGDTHDLTTIEHGAYLLLLFAMWRAGGQLPNDDRKLAKYAKLNSQQWARLRETIMDFMTVSDDGLTITQGRLVDELEYVRTHSRKQAKNARSRWTKITDPRGAVKQTPPDPFNGSPANPLENNNVGDAMGMPNACQTDAPTPTPSIVGTNVPTLSVSEGPSTAKESRKRIAYPDDFNAAWAAFPTTPNMSKAEALPEWKKLTPDDRAMVLPSIAGYRTFLKANPTLQVIHFCRYLSKRRYEGYSATISQLETPAVWEGRLADARKVGEWASYKWGPLPGQPGCRVPPALLVEGDGAGWIEARAA